MSLHDHGGHLLRNVSHLIAERFLHGAVRHLSAVANHASASIRGWHRLCARIAAVGVSNNGTALTIGRGRLPRCSVSWSAWLGRSLAAFELGAIKLNLPIHKMVAKAGGTRGPISQGDRRPALVAQHGEQLVFLEAMELVHV